MDVPISEISYGFAFIENMIRSYRSRRVVPFFPTLREEAIRGYDARLRVAGQTRFYQFKIAKVMVRARARECSPPSNLRTKFLRMPLMRRPYSEQHNVLVQLRSRRQYVHYVCPRFYDSRTFHQSYRNVRVHLDSAYIDPNDIGPIRDNDQHNVSFEPSARIGWFCSEPKRLDVRSSESVLPATPTVSGERTLLDQASADVKEIRAALEEAGADLHDPDQVALRGRRPNAIRELAYLCRHFLGLHPMMIVSRSKQG
jgi:hypothetical protein